LTVRLVRVDLPESVEVLITNLWEEEGYANELFKDLYFMRWGKLPQKQYGLKVD
jgi:hypothetical protein